MRNIYNTISKDSLYRNSTFLIASNLIVAGLGFIFWIIYTKQYSAEQIGIATTLISSMSLITAFSLLGLDDAVIRYLPISKDKSKIINSSFAIVTLAAIAASVIFLYWIKSDSLTSLVTTNINLLLISFILFVIFSSLNEIVQSIFIAFRSAKYVLLKNSLFSTLKLIFPFFLISYGGYGLFSSWGISMSIAFIFSFIILKVKFKYNPQPVINKTVIQSMSSYSFNNYIAGFFGELPKLLFPLMITILINPETTAYFYMAMTISSFLFLIPEATTQSLFAEGSTNENELRNYIKKVTKVLVLILIPAILVTIVFGNYILLFFGKTYSKEGLGLLQLFALSAIPVSINLIVGKIARIKYRMREVILINLLGAIIILSLSYFLMTKSTLGIGWAWLIGQSVMSLAYLLTFSRYRSW